MNLSYVLLSLCQHATCLVQLSRYGLLVGSCFTRVRPHLLMDVAYSSSFALKSKTGTDMNQPR